MSRAGRGAAALALLALGGCGGVQSALDPRGPHAGAIAALWWAMLAGGTLVLLLVTALTAAAVSRRARAPHARPLSTRGATWLVALGGGVVPVVVLTGLLVYSVTTGRALSAPRPADALTVQVIGHQWWWEVHYLDAGGGRIAATANEIHVPVGEPVRILLTSADVIHSFWVPNLLGKMDLIPGIENATWLQADTAGVYRGQCAEFCGLQHALMGLLVIAAPPPDFRAWLTAQARPAAEPTDGVRALGQQVFLGGPCVLCHAIRGTPALGGAGPDLTHLASRRTLAAATVPNTTGHLAGWILDPQRVKPGNHMPPTNLTPVRLHALLAYLEGLD